MSAALLETVDVTLCSRMRTIVETLVYASSRAGRSCSTTCSTEQGPMRQITFIISSSVAVSGFSMVCERAFLIMHVDLCIGRSNSN